MIFWKTLEAVGIFLGLGVVGFFLLARRAIAKEALSTLSFLSLDVAVPALVFYDMMEQFSLEKYPNWWVYPLVWLGAFGFLWVLSWVFSFMFASSYRKEVFVSLLYPNAIFIPLILLPSLFPGKPEITVDLFLFTMLFSFFLFQGFGFFYRAQRPMSWNGKKLFPPLVVMLVISLCIHYAGLRMYVPAFLVDVAKRIGVLSIPLLLFVIGGNVYLDRYTTSFLPLRAKVGFVLVKNGVFPLLHLWLLGFVPLSPLFRFFIFLQSALPPVTALPVLVERAGGNRLAVQSFFLWSVGALVVTLPPLLWLYEKVYGV
ncbi:MAG: AEC family transporter [Brevinematales bacterium]|nr:AEC family transporter [Brevinematales bacterium]